MKQTGIFEKRREWRKTNRPRVRFSWHVSAFPAFYRLSFSPCLYTYVAHISLTLHDDIQRQARQTFVFSFFTVKREITSGLCEQKQVEEKQRVKTAKRSDSSQLGKRKELERMNDTGRETDTHIRMMIMAIWLKPAKDALTSRYQVTRLLTRSLTNVCLQAYKALTSYVHFHQCRDCESPYFSRIIRTLTFISTND